MAAAKGSGRESCRIGFMSSHNICAFIRHRSPRRDAHNRVRSSTAIEDVGLSSYFAGV